MTAFNGKIFALMGKSASGKDSLYPKILGLLSMRKVNILPIVMYTTRPIRSNETDGVEYFFITDDELNHFIEEKRVIEERKYNTKYGIWRYAVIEDGQISGDKTYFMLTTPEGVAGLSEKYGAEHVIPLYVYVEDGERLTRALNREKGQDFPRYDEMCRRFLSDTKDFEEVDNNLSVMRFENDDKEECAQQIAEYITEIVASNHLTR